MSDNLPLIPRKKADCTDVRPVLREVFRSLDAQPALTAVLKSDKSLKQNEISDIQRDEISEFKKIKNHEEVLKNEYAKMLGEDYDINNEISEADTSSVGWKKEFGIIQRQDLLPDIFEDINHQRRQWMTQELRKRSYDPNIAAKVSQSLESFAYTTLSTKNTSFQSVSHDAPVTQPPAPLSQSWTWPISARHVVCEPSRLDFVNFIVGHVHTQRIRLVNLSKYDIRLSIQPPSHPELKVELISRRGLKLTSSSTLHLRVRFEPRDVCTIEDELLIRTSLGSPFAVPISCFMVPPLLDVIVPNNEDASSLPWTCVLPTNSDVLDLGARLLGEVHRVELQLQCNVEHASFYVMTEEAWCSFFVDQEAIRSGVLVVGAFSVAPVRWAGARRGLACCRAPSAGLRTAALRVLSSTAVLRPLHVVADAVLFSPEHVTLKTSEKNYDIFSEGDPSCPHYIHLGTAFPNQSLSSTIHLINNSSVPYSYHWSVRCWDAECNPKEGATSSGCSWQNIHENDKEAANLLSVESWRGVVPPRSSAEVRVGAAGAERAGGWRAALRLILTGIPRECISREYEHMIISKETVEEKKIPGLCNAWSRSVCKLLCTQVEVWWGVVPVRFTLQPPVVTLCYSTRVDSIDIPVEVTQLKGPCCVRVEWCGEEGTPRVIPLAQSRTVAASLRVPLPITSGTHRDTATYQLKSASGEWYTQCCVTRCGYAPLATLEPRICWMDTQPPSARLTTQLRVNNNTASTIKWKVETYEWGGRCRCEGATPCRGLLAPYRAHPIAYQLHAPQDERCVLRLVELQQHPHQTRRRTALVGCRSLEPRVLMRVLPYKGEINHGSEFCKLEENTDKMRFSSVALVRPLCALTVGCRSLFLLSCTNITPVATTIHWEEHEDYEHSLHISFSPDHVDVGPYATVTIQVCLEATAVCGRRLWVQRASLSHSRARLYLVLDTAIDGRKVSIDVPLNNYTMGVATITKIEHGEPLTSDDTCLQDEIFIEYDNLERQHEKLKSMEPPAWADNCPCFATSETSALSIENYVCLEFRNVDINTAASQHVTIRNEGALPAQWRAAALPGSSPRPVVDRLGQCVLKPAGQCMRMRCVPASGQLPAGGVARVAVSVEADSWGVYKGRLLLQIENMEPVTLDVWVEAVGPPLCFALKPTAQYDDSPILWVSTSDPERRVHVANTSCADILMYIHVLREHEHPQDSLPFRLYLRFYDTPKAFSYEDGYVLCVREETPATSQTTCTCQEGPSTGIELFLCEDYGKTDDSIFQIEPRELRIAAGASAAPIVTLLREDHESTRAVLLVRTRPVQRYGSNWYRPDVPHQVVRLRAFGFARLQLSCDVLQVKMSALQLSPGGITRVRKYFQAMNVGDGVLKARALTKSPWSVFPRNDKGDKCIPNCRKNSKQLLLDLSPRSSVELCAACTIPWGEQWTPSSADQPLISTTATQLDFYDSDNVLLARIPLTVVLECPRLRVAPPDFDFGPVAREDARKTYFTVSHTSTLCPMELLILYEGDDVFTVSPKSLTLLPYSSGRFYVQYIASGWIAEASGKVRVCAKELLELRRVAESCGESQPLNDWWCCCVALRATSTGDRARALPPHDFTDDPVILQKTFNW